MSLNYLREMGIDVWVPRDRPRVSAPVQEPVPVQAEATPAPPEVVAPELSRGSAEVAVTIHQYRDLGLVVPADANCPQLLADIVQAVFGEAVRAGSPGFPPRRLIVFGAALESHVEAGTTSVTVADLSTFQSSAAAKRALWSSIKGVLR